MTKIAVVIRWERPVSERDANASIWPYNALCAVVNPARASAQTYCSLRTHVVNDKGRYRQSCTKCGGLLRSSGSVACD